ncbi:MAG: sulfate reduction electron transfer complex DsrMKJOP subunit DsrO, partial [Bacillota bacterium]
DAVNPGGRIPRRRFLQGVGASVLAGLGGAQVIRLGAEAGQSAPELPATRQRWALVIDLRRCDGCKKCTQACQAMHHTPEGVEWIKVYTLTNAAGGPYYLPRVCMQCENAPCYEVCPVGATFYAPDGVVLIDQDRCIGCRLCMVACPYGARYFTWDDPPPVDPAQLDGESGPEFPVPQQKGTVSKCVLCVHRLREGKLPACVEACTMEAIYVGDWEADLATNGRETVQLSRFLKENDAFRLKEELNTRPRVWYIAGHGQDLEYKYSL